MPGWCRFGVKIQAVTWAKTTLLILSLGVTSSAFSAEKAPLFSEDSILKAVLTAPLTQAYEQRDQEVRLWFPGQWSYTGGDGQSERLEVAIRGRGNFRRQNCQLMPLQLNFKKKQVNGTLFDGQNKLKLVAPCQHGAESQQDLVLEYLAYRTLEILTEKSFGTRLVRLSYVDSDEKKGSWTDLVFLIEDEGDLGKRLGLDKARTSANRFEELDMPATALVELFQFMIANHDYSVLQGPEDNYCCHNVEMYVSEEAADKRIPIPYDFDMSGLVNARYAAPPEHLPIRLVRTRYYRGLCQPEEVFESTVRHFQSKREEILDLYRRSEELSRLRKSRTLAYLQQFFDILDSESKTREQIIDRCRGQERLDAMMADPATGSTLGQ